MHFRPFLPPPPARAGRRGPGRRGAAVCAGALLAVVAPLCGSGPLAAVPASAATDAPRPGDVADDRGDAKQSKGRARVTAAVLDLDGSGRTPTVYGADGTYDTASIVKVDILAAALLQAQDAGRPLGAKTRAQAEAMIERSDNAATNVLWRRIGKAPGLQAANKRLGLSETRGGPGPKWGLTRTTPSDQIRLLRAVFDTRATRPGKPQPLSKASRTWMRTLMTRIAGEQAWGVSAAAADGSRWALKNGWLPRSTTGLWDVNSVGEVKAGGHRYLVAVLSDGNPSMKDGIARVEHAARAAVSSAKAH
ncbi:serine hydrolase [Streptomyces sp. V3I7]|uniref:serine hydrolase n=1 Tax=Streptomyces sp. V3I7 TaxID=3042278 RepID=UPI00277EC3EC|nr:serine hydrolase [Streptomyces sp. V3I7]MDQ0988891.1 hypothetical protein [Streptomyces sp. V3I7]